MRCAIVHYHELALKGRNRPFFEARLVRNLRQVLRDLSVTQVESLPGRIRISLPNETPWKLVKTRLARIFGIANFSLAQSVPLEKDAHASLDAVKSAIGDSVRELPFTTFRVTTKRADKRFPMTSMDVDREVGAHLCRLTGKRVSLDYSYLSVHIELFSRDDYFSILREAGSGGLVSGMCGMVACLT